MTSITNNPTLVQPPIVERELALTTWFSGLNTADQEGIEALFAEEHFVHNAASPLDFSPGAIGRLLEDFFGRTSQRKFTVREIAHSTTRSFAHWSAELTFADGSTVYGKVVDEFTVTVHGIDVFEFDEAGMIVGTDIVHETTTVGIAAARSARQNN